MAWKWRRYETSEYKKQRQANTQAATPDALTQTPSLPIQRLLPWRGAHPYQYDIHRHTQNKHGAAIKKYLHLPSGTQRIRNNSRNPASHHVQQLVARENIHMCTVTPPMATGTVGAHIHYWDAICYRQNNEPRGKNWSYFQHVCQWVSITLSYTKAPPENLTVEQIALQVPASGRMQYTPYSPMSSILISSSYL